jgi:hypothetical protein
MIRACTAIMPHISIFRREADDRVPDIARARQPCCHCRIGGVIVNADIIQFISRPKREDAQTDFPAIAFRTALREPLIGSVDATPDQHGGPASREA